MSRSWTNVMIQDAYNLESNQELESQAEMDRALQERLIMEDFGTSTLGRVSNTFIHLPLML